MEPGPENQIRADLRRLTEDTRRARLELEQLLYRGEPDRTRSVAHDRVVNRRRSRR